MGRSEAWVDRDEIGVILGWEFGKGKSSCFAIG